MLFNAWTIFDTYHNRFENNEIATCCFRVDFQFLKESRKAFPSQSSEIPGRNKTHIYYNLELTRRDIK